MPVAAQGEGGGKKADGFFRIGELVSEILDRWAVSSFYRKF